MGSRPVVVVTGAGGLLGRAVLRELAGRGWEVRGLIHAGLDIADARAVRDSVAAARPSLVVNGAAMTNVDDCESQPERAWAVNAEGAGHVARAAAEAGAEVVHISTDYVFDGEKGHYIESDEPSPIQTYGRAKLAGEDLVRTANSRHYILRSAWIYGEGGRNFFSKFFDVVDRGEPIKAIADQCSSPTYAPDLAEAVAEVARTERYGTYHAVNEGVCSAADLCRHLAAAARIPIEVEGVPSAEMPRAAARPADSSLVGARWAEQGFAPLRRWQDAAAQFWSDLHSARNA
jgi:dTDP-4-dehydrorhamnose reductase